MSVEVDTLGGYNQEVLATLTRLGRLLARVVGKEEAGVVFHLRQRVGVLLNEQCPSGTTSLCCVVILLQCRW